MKIGVLALQGAFREHIAVLRKLSVDAVTVRRAPELRGLDGLILPGGESTTMGKLLRELGLLEPLRDAIAAGLPVWGTCAGLILLAREIVGEPPYLCAMNLRVRRNAYGRQIDSFSREEDIPFLGGRHPLVFIRAPVIERVGGNARALLEVDGRIVAAEEGNRLATSFHPELTDDTAWHEYFLKKCTGNL